LAAGYQRYSREVSAREFEVVAVDVRLAPVAAETPTSTAPSRAPRESAADAPSRTAAIAATAGAVVLVAGGFGAFINAGSKQSDARAACPALTNCDDRKPGVHVWDWVALGAWGAGVGLGVIATILWLSPSRTVRASVGPSSAHLEGTF
jgi:hypothetical protein